MARLILILAGSGTGSICNVPGTSSSRAQTRHLASRNPWLQAMGGATRAYSSRPRVGIGAVLVIVLAIVASVESYDLHTFLLVFAGFAIGWVSGTIARYVYPPPQKSARKPSRPRAEY